jgi:osmoprotectant transport system permease protein
MNFVQQALSYLLTADNWTGPVGLAARTLEHLEYTAVAVGASALVAVPVGLIIGHTGRGTMLVVGAVNGLRSLPTLGVLLLGVLVFGLGAGCADVAGRPVGAGRHLCGHCQCRADGGRCRPGDGHDGGPGAAARRGT